MYVVIEKFTDTSKPFISHVYGPYTHEESARALAKKINTDDNSALYDNERLKAWVEELVDEDGTSKPRRGCRHCGGLMRWFGDAPLPEPLQLYDRGLTEIHCGHDNASFPRFTFTCPICDNGIDATKPF